MKELIFVFTVFSLSACYSLKQISFADDQPFNENKISDSLQIQFNGVAHFYLQYQGNAIITDPFMSNPSFRNVSSGKIFSDSALIHSFKQKPKCSNIKVVAVGHAHYDHILDLPYYLPFFSNDTRVLGSANVDSLCRALDSGIKVINVFPFSATDSTIGEWFFSADSTIRVMAIQSAHLPHFMGIHIYKGAITKHLPAFPQKAKAFKQDVTLAYLIDFLDQNKRPAKRIYFASSASAFPVGFFPKSILEEKQVDVAIFSVALLQHAKHYPHMQISFLQPQHTILCHWENFFKNRNQSLKLVSLTNHRKLHQHLKELRHLTNFHFVQPGNSVVFP